MKQEYISERLHKDIYRLSHKPDHAKITIADAPINSSLAMPHKILRFDNASTDERVRLPRDAKGITIDSITCTELPMTTWHLIQRKYSIRQQSVSAKNAMECSCIDAGVSPNNNSHSLHNRQSWSKFWVD